MKKNIIQKKNLTKLSWPMSTKFDKTIFLFRKKKPQNYHGPLMPNLILSYQAVYITK